MRQYTLSPEAQQDLLDIRDYLRQQAGLSVSRRVLRTIAKAMGLLSGTPGLGHAREDLTDEPVKFWPVFSYLIVYDPASRPIGIVRVLDGSQDIKSLLR